MLNLPPVLDAALSPLLRLVALGGPVVWLLAAMAVLALAIVGLKAVQFARFGLADRRRIERALTHWREQDGGAALRVLDRVRHPLGVMLALAMRQAPSGAETLLREELQRLGDLLAARLHAGLRALELIATTAPLVGLLGTVLGMIDAFRGLEIAGAQADPGVLSGGIWQALLTTAIGLIVAIPCTLAHGWLETRAEHAVRRIEDLVTGVFTAALQRTILPGHGTPHFAAPAERGSRPDLPWMAAGHGRDQA